MKHGLSVAKNLVGRLLVVAVIVTVGVVVATRWPQRLPKYASTFSDLAFDQVAQPGFDAEGQARLADSAWSMRYYQAEGSDLGYLYVGTDNNILGLTLSALRQEGHPDTSLPVEPPQIRRYRPDLGPATWEVVLDIADHQQPPYHDQGFRSMAIYRAKVDGRSYLYAGTMAAHSPSLWRSATGEPGSWEWVHTFSEQTGSVRGLISHDDGLLYMSTTAPGDIAPGGIGTIWATDGVTFTSVVTDGFGNPANAGVTALSSFNGCLYAGTYNPTTGYEVWKLRCTSFPDAPPQQIVRGGAGYAHDEAVMSLRVFQGYLYLGTGIPLGYNPDTRHGPRGCSVLRIGPDDQWESIVGKQQAHPLSGYGAGFGWYLNAYCWYMQEYDDHLYLGTWDLSRTIAFLGERAEDVAPPFKPLLNELVARPQDWGSPMGGDLYRTADGVHWEPIFLNGLGNPDNHGIRTLEPTPLGLFVGTENPFTRLEVWRLNSP